MTKVRKNQRPKESATIYIDGIVTANLIHWPVTEKQFFLGLLQFSAGINIDSRLKSTHELETYHIDDEELNDFRECGIRVKLIGYAYHSNYYMHHVVYNHIRDIMDLADTYPLNVIKENLKVKEFIPTKVKRIC